MRLRIADDVVFRDLAGESVLLNLSTGTYFGLDAIGTRLWHLVAEHGSSALVIETLLAEYDVDVGIGWHRDKPHFDRIFGLSLGSACKLRFRRPAGKSWERHTLDAEPRSLYMMAGESRRVWEHSIPAVAAPRYSITFRTMSDEPDLRTPA